MKEKSRKKAAMVITIIAVLILALVIAVLICLPKPIKSFDTAFDLSQLTDGSYPGYCDNGLVKAQVEVDVQDHIIADVRLIKHDNGKGSAAEAITDKVIQYQSVEVDAISGATMSSTTILKAIESALSEGMEK